MARIPTNDFYYCILAYITNIEKNKIHCDKKLRYTLVYKQELEDKSEVYFDVNDLKKVKLFDPNEVNINEWYIISKIKLNLNNKEFQKEYLKRIIKYSLPELEESLENIKFENVMMLKK